MSPVVLLILLGVVSSEFVNIGFRDCKSQFKIKEVQASGCELKETDGGKKVCSFKANSKPVIRIKFVPDQEVPTFKTAIKAKIGDTMIDFPIDNPDACRSGLPCPLKAGTEYTYEQGIDIAHNYPAHERVQVNWIVDREDQPGKDLCVIFLAQIAEP